MPHPHISAQLHLPIEDHLDQLCAGISQHRLTLLEAPPGSGKTTLLPLRLLREPWLAGKKILVLQPRRVATRSVAARMASLLREQVGATVGYHVRMERVVGANTRIEVITEGLLTRRLIAEPDLPGVGLVIFDEFHERSLHSDIALVMALESAQSLRPDLRIVVMSATLGEQLSSGILRDAWRYTFSARPFPLQLFYSPPSRSPVWEITARAVIDAATRFEGDILAFLPGRYEIERTRDLVQSKLRDYLVLELYGEQPLSEQVKALQPSKAGQHKVIISSPIAETSLTIEGVRIVVDSGLHKVARSNPHGITLLSTERITQDAAEQRAGRAARTAPGVCIRLWSEHEQRALRPQREPEVLRADLTATLLDLAAWGVTKPEHFGWITAPSQAQIAGASSALIALGAITPEGRVTVHGRTLSSLGTHPALAQMCLAARSCGHEKLAATILSVLDERRSRRASVDMLAEFSQAALSARAREVRSHWLTRIEALPLPRERLSVPDDAATGYLLASAFPARVARQRQPGSERYLLSCGQGAALPLGDALSRYEFVVAFQLQDGDSDLRILAAVPFDAESLLTGALAGLVARRCETFFDETRGALLARNVEHIGAIELRQRVSAASSPEESQRALLKFLSSEQGWTRVPFSAKAHGTIQRVQWLRRTLPGLELPDLSQAALRADLEVWLAPFLAPSSTLKALTEELVEQALSARLTHSQRLLLDREAPPHLKVKSARLRPIRYDLPEGPLAEVVIQDLFGTASTPLISSAKVPLTISLLSPARRPVQITRDLASFWRGAYHEVRKELKRRYPKHSWPEDPTL